MLAAALVVGMAGPSVAGQVKLEIRSGLVTLDAKDATLREIMAEWARVGQTRVVNAERAPGGPVTMQLTDVPERQALETLFRSAAGFIAAPRQVPQAFLSTYDRIMVMPGMRPAVVPTAGSLGSSNQQPVFRNRTILPPVTPADDDEDETDQNPAMQTPAMPGGQRPGSPLGNPYTPTGVFQPPTTAPSQPGALPPAASRPGLPTAPPPPIK
jgi:hypothetical protein